MNLNQKIYNIFSDSTYTTPKKVSQIQSFQLLEPEIRLNYPDTDVLDKNINQNTVDMNKKKNTYALIGSVIGCALGIAIPVLLKSSHHINFHNPINFHHLNTAITRSNLSSIGKSILHFEPKTRDSIIMALGAITGGALGGSIADKGENIPKKIKEGIFQFANTAIPLGTIAGLRKSLDFLEKKGITNKISKFLHKQDTAKAAQKALKDTNAAKIGSLIAGLSIGAPLAIFTANKVNNLFATEDGKYERKFKLKDLLVHCDDIFTSIASLGFGGLSKVISKVVPLIFTNCGREAGNE